MNACSIDKRVVFAVLAISLPASVNAMQRMGDGEMASVVAQEGVSIGLEVRLNTDEDGAPLHGGNSTLNNCSSSEGSLTESDCRFALNAAGRPGEWVVFRGVYGSLLIDEIRLDAGLLSDPGAPSTYFDDARFEDPDQQCLLPGGTCDNASLIDDPALVFEYPSTTTSYDPSANGGTGASSGYTSLEIGYRIEETILQFDPNDFSRGGPEGSFLGVQVSDNNNPRAGIAISGRAYVYGF